VVSDGCEGEPIGCRCPVHATDRAVSLQIQLPEEAEFPIIFAEPLNIVVAALERHLLWHELLQNLPDCSLESLQDERSALI
jgi:hypothetical protein